MDLVSYLNRSQALFSKPVQEWPQSQFREHQSCQSTTSPEEGRRAGKQKGQQDFKVKRLVPVGPDAAWAGLAAPLEDTGSKFCQFPCGPEGHGCLHLDFKGWDLSSRASGTGPQPGRAPGSGQKAATGPSHWAMGQQCHHSWAWKAEHWAKENYSQTLRSHSVCCGVWTLLGTSLSCACPTFIFWKYTTCLVSQIQSWNWPHNDCTLSLTHNWFRWYSDKTLNFILQLMLDWVKTFGAVEMEWMYVAWTWILGDQQWNVVD